MERHSCVRRSRYTEAPLVPPRRQPIDRAQNRQRASTPPVRHDRRHNLTRRRVRPQRKRPPTHGGVVPQRDGIVDHTEQWPHVPVSPIARVRTRRHKRRLSCKHTTRRQPKHHRRRHNTRTNRPKHRSLPVVPNTRKPKVAPSVPARQSRTEERALTPSGDHGVTTAAAALPAPRTACRASPCRKRPPKSGRYWARSKPDADRPDATGAHFVADLQDLLGAADDEPRPLSATPFHSVDGQIQHSSRALLAPDWQAEGRPGRGGPRPAPVAVARLLRDLADLLDGGGEL
jgi:hypothetical protein